MVEEPSEAEELASVADALLVNLGTVTERQAEAMRRAIKVANEKGVPWVLDPVGVQLLSFRRQLALEFVGLHPAIIRGNHAEIDTLGPVDCVTLATGAIDTIQQSKQSNNLWWSPDVAGSDGDGMRTRRDLRGVPRTGTVPAGRGGFCVEANEAGRGTCVEAGEDAGKLSGRAGGCAVGVEL